jgi:phosphatidylserine/phosphatidylglycerophosphate/cardiolipin synthase-like enzyme
MVEKRMKTIYLCIVIMMLTIMGGCQQKEPLEPPYEDFPIVLVNDRDYVPFLLSSITEAEQYIHVVMYFMKYYPQDSLNGVSQLQRALIACGQQDIDVKIVLEWSDYNSSLNATNESTFVYLDSLGLEVRFDPVSVTTHAKFVIIDDRIAYIGSSNWSISAFEENNEVNIKIEDQTVVREMESYFQELWSVSSRGMDQH